MAIYPCMRDGERFAGEARNVYLTLYRGDRSLKLRLVVCPSCEDELAAEWVARSLFRDQDGSWAQWLEGMPEDALWQRSESPQSTRNVWNAWRTATKSE